jgi:hypothetical protein
MLETILASPAADPAREFALTERCKRLQAPGPFCRYIMQGPAMKKSLRAKLVRTMIVTLVFVSTATLLVVAGMNYFAVAKDPEDHRGAPACQHRKQGQRAG